MTALPDDLDDLATPDDYDPDNPQPAPPIAGGVTAEDREANRHLRAIAALRHELDRVDTIYGHELDRLRARLEERRSVILRRIAWHEAPLIGLHAARLAVDPKGARSIELPHGTLRSRTPSKPSVHVVDDAAFVAWAEDNMAELVRRTPKPALDAVKRAVGDARLVVTLPEDEDAEGAVVASSTGERVPGMVARRPVTSYTVVVDEDAQAFDLIELLRVDGAS